MRKYLVMALLAVVVLGANAEEKKEQVRRMICVGLS